MLALNVTVVLDDNAQSYLKLGAIGSVKAQIGNSPSAITHIDLASSGFQDYLDNLLNLDWEQDYINCCSYALTEIKAGYNGSISINPTSGVVTGAVGWNVYYEVEYDYSGQRVDCIGGDNDICTEFPCAGGGDC